MLLLRISSLISFIFLTSLSAVEFGQLYSVPVTEPSKLTESNSVTLNAGDVLEILSVSHTKQSSAGSRNNYYSVSVRAEDINQVDGIGLFGHSLVAISAFPSNPQIVGPCKVWVYGNRTTSKGAISYKITRASEVE